MIPSYSTTTNLKASITHRSIHVELDEARGRRIPASQRQIRAIPKQRVNTAKQSSSFAAAIRQVQSTMEDAMKDDAGVVEDHIISSTPNTIQNRTKGPFHFHMLEKTPSVTTGLGFLMARYAFFVEKVPSGEELHLNSSSAAKRVGGAVMRIGCTVDSGFLTLITKFSGCFKVVPSSLLYLFLLRF